MNVRIRLRQDRSALFTPYEFLAVGVARLGVGPDAGPTMHLGLGCRLGRQTALLVQARYVLISFSHRDELLQHARIEMGLSTALE